MAKIFVDLNTRIVPKGHEVYMTRPGKAYRLYRDVVERSAVVVDLPYLDLPKGAPLGDIADLDNRIKRARAIRAWYLSPQAARKDFPSLKLEDYGAGEHNRGLPQLRGVVQAYLGTLKAGDLVIVPPAAYSQPVMIGEIVGGVTERSSFVSPVYGEDYPLATRPVRWLGHIAKKDLVAEVLDATEKPSAIFLLGKSQRVPIYEAAYRNYVDNSLEIPDYTSRLFVSRETFTTSSDFLIQAFIKILAANIKARDKGGEPPTLVAALLQDVGDFAPELKTNVNSPGFLTLVSKRIIPLVFDAMFALAVTVGPDAVAAAQAGQIKIGNSQAPADDPCTALVFEETIAQLKIYGLTDEWVTACELAKEASTKAGAAGAAKVQQQR